MIRNGFKIDHGIMKGLFGCSQFTDTVPADFTRRLELAPVGTVVAHTNQLTQSFRRTLPSRQGCTCTALHFWHAP